MDIERISAVREFFHPEVEKDAEPDGVSVNDSEGLKTLFRGMKPSE